MYKYSWLTLLPCHGQSILIKIDVEEQMNCFLATGNNRTIPSSCIALSSDSFHDGSGRQRSVCDYVWNKCLVGSSGSWLSSHWVWPHPINKYKYEVVPGESLSAGKKE